MAQSLERGRLDWVDVAKGICIILVVMMHSTLGVEKAIGAETSLHAFIEWARPFRMPDFFLISGLFLAARIDRPWRAYLDTKVVHFAYFYVLWVNIQFAMKAPGLVREVGLDGVAAQYLMSYVQPFGTLWFIYLLAVFFVATKFLRDVASRSSSWAPRCCMCWPPTPVGSSSTSSPTASCSSIRATRRRRWCWRWPPASGAIPRCCWFLLSPRGAGSTGWRSTPASRSRPGPTCRSPTPAWSP